MAQQQQQQTMSDRPIESVQLRAGEVILWPQIGQVLNRMCAAQGFSFSYGRAGMLEIRHSKDPGKLDERVVPLATVLAIEPRKT